MGFARPRFYKKFNLSSLNTFLLQLLDALRMVRYRALSLQAQVSGAQANENNGQNAQYQPPFLNGQVKPGSNSSETESLLLLYHAPSLPACAVVSSFLFGLVKRGRIFELLRAAVAGGVDAGSLAAEGGLACAREPPPFPAVDARFYGGAFLEASERDFLDAFRAQSVILCRCYEPPGERGGKGMHDGYLSIFDN